MNLNIDENSNLTKFFDDNLAKKIDETSSASSLSGYQNLLTQINTKVYSNTNIKHFCSVVEADTPKGQIPVMIDVITSDSSNINNTIILSLDNATGLAIDDTITGDTSGATATIIYIEDTLVLVKTLSDTLVFVEGETLNTATYTITKINTNEWSTNVFLQNLTETKTLANGELFTDMKTVESKLELINIECVSKTVKTGWTMEAMQDLISITNIKQDRNVNLFIESGVNVIVTTIKQKLFTYMKNNAFIRPNISLQDSIGATSSISHVYADLYDRINQSIGAIGTNTAIAGKYSVICSSKVYAGIMTFLKGSVKIEDGYVLLPNGAKMIEDGYSFTDYLLVALADTDTNNSAVFYTPYSYNIVTAKDSITMNDVVKILVRDDTKVNKLVKAIDSKSTMMEITVVEGLNIPNSF